jgi:hypothetical protein
MEDKKTSTILLRVSLEQKELWVGQAHDERVSLSEWIRRRCNGGLAAGAAETTQDSDAPKVHPVREVVGTSRPTSAPPAPAASPSVRPDPKSK